MLLKVIFQGHLQQKEIRKGECYLFQGHLQGKEIGQGECCLWDDKKVLLGGTSKSCLVALHLHVLKLVERDGFFYFCFLVSSISEPHCKPPVPPS